MESSNSSDFTNSQIVYVKSIKNSGDCHCITRVIVSKHEYMPNSKIYPVFKYRVIDSFIINKYVNFSKCCNCFGLATYIALPCAHQYCDFCCDKIDNCHFCFKTVTTFTKNNLKTNLVNYTSYFNDHDIIFVNNNTQHDNILCYNNFNTIINEAHFGASNKYTHIYDDDSFPECITDKKNKDLIDTDLFSLFDDDNDNKQNNKPNDKPTTINKIENKPIIIMDTHIDMPADEQVIYKNLFSLNFTINKKIFKIPSNFIQFNNITNNITV